MLEGLIVLIAIVTLIIALYSDAGSAKKKHSNYFLKVQKPSKKTKRDLPNPDFSRHDGFFTKLNSL